MSLKGYEGRLYYNTGSEGSPSWSPINTVRDVTIGQEANEIDDTSRTTNGWRSRIQGLKQWGAEFEMIYTPSDIAWQAVRESYYLGTPAEILIMDQDITIDGAEGLRGFAEVTGFDKEEPLEDVQINSTTFVGSSEPTAVVATGGVVAPIAGLS